jgi:serine phosphatase RsbU (regulator of sigma subunit)
MLDVVQSWRHESPEAIVDALLHAVMLFSGRAVQVDDMTAMVIKVVEEPTG